MGVDIAIIETGSGNGGEVAIWDTWIQPGQHIAKPHVHPHQQETFEVLKGRVRGQLDGKEQEAETGETVVTPPGTPHFWGNGGDEEAHLRVEMRPALTTAGLLERVFEASTRGQVREDGTPKFLELALIQHDHPGQFYRAFPPVPVQRTVMKLLYPFAKLVARRRT